jgi:hypothetical protein
VGQPRLVVLFGTQQLHVGGDDGERVVDLVTRTGGEFREAVQLGVPHGGVEIQP